MNPEIESCCDYPELIPLYIYVSLCVCVTECMYIEKFIKFLLLWHLNCSTIVNKKNKKNKISFIIKLIRKNSICISSLTNLIEMDKFFLVVNL